MEENGQHQWNQQYQLALGTTLLVVCSSGRVFVCRWVLHFGAYGRGVGMRLIRDIWYKKLLLYSVL